MFKISIITAYQGGAEVYRLNGQNWALHQTITPLDPALQPVFGGSLALQNGTLIIGSKFTNGAARGSVHFYREVGGFWQEDSVLTDQSPQYDLFQFGHELAIDGDTLIVSANYDADPSSRFIERGLVFIYTLSTNNSWTLNTILESSGAEPANKFGYKTSLGNDILVIGDAQHGAVIDNILYHYDAGISLFVNDNGTWNNTDTLVHEDVNLINTENMSLQGETLYLGAPGQLTEDSDNGAVLAFSLTSTSDSVTVPFPFWALIVFSSMLIVTAKRINKYGRYYSNSSK